MGAGRVISKSLLAPLKGVNSLINETAMSVSEQVVTPAARLIGGLGKKTLVKKVDPSLANGYTGYQASAFANHAAGWGTLAVAGGIGVASGAAKPLGVEGRAGFEGIETRASKAGQSSYGGKPGVFDADGVGTSTQAPTLGASGDLVFGLHNGRRG
jgi:hypothetical protein